ncbi:right-handed parallel beta-helix repeat-containing protein [Kitasatospora sp. NBC_00039]|uniref:right-handed parallel beta-helix repeat-containing protein n=1 Tax=Kitasatospora sp. NBC_00039 TaxID=2903565 RepID=UPI00324C95A9
MSAAAAVVQPGQTVEIAAGSYVDTAVTVTRSGTAAAPITFRGPDKQHGNANITGGAPNYPDSAVVVRGADHIRFENLALGSYQKPVVVVDGGHDVSFTGVWGSGGSGAHITNGSGQVTFAGGFLHNLRGPAFRVDGGSTGTVLSTNIIDTGGSPDGPGILVDGAPDTVVVSNNVRTECFAGITLDGASGGAVVENNAVNTAQAGTTPCGENIARAAGISVAAGATAGTKVDYNVVDPISGAAAYSWAGATYAAQPEFTAASGQGAHDFVASTWVRKGPDAPLDHLVDSADENAPGMLKTDYWGKAPADDPTVPNTGTGSGFRDRGAYESLTFGSLFTPAGPARLLDTREPVGVPSAQAVPAWGTVDLQVAGVAGVPATGVTAVTMNVTVTEPTQAGHLTVYPHGDVAPNASNLNWAAGRTIPNLVTVPVNDGKVSFYNASGGTVHVIADLAGYYSAKGDLFHPQGPARLLDTREPVGVPSAQAVPAWGTVDLQVAGVAGVPATGMTAVTMNVTIAEPKADGHLTVYPHGGKAPNASNLNWPAGRTIANLVTVPVKDGKVSFFNASGGTVHVIADLAGYYAAEGRLTYYSAGPVRFMDTREDTHRENGDRPAGTVPAWGTLDVYVGDVPYLAAATLNVTVTEPGAEGHLTVYPHGDAAPNASNLNFLAGETIPNQVVVPVKDGMISLYNASGAPLHLVVDFFGFQSY